MLALALAVLLELGGGVVAAEPQVHWSYQPPVSAPPPVVRDPAWAWTPIDRFILGELERADVEPAEDADPATLARRVYFGLTGLPPTPEELDSFAARGGRRGLPELLDRLLASPRFGEQWARHWFDIVRFAESVTLRGFVYKNAWRYRDYVVESFDRDLPLDLFLQQQVAGDLLAASTLEEQQRQLIATTFLMLGNSNLEEQDKRQLEMDVVDEQIDVLGKAFLGQTIGCARCHDHKFDPVSMAEYYSLAGIFRNLVPLKHDNVSSWTERPLPVSPELEKTLAAHEREVAELRREIDTLKAAIKASAAASPAATRGASLDAADPKRLAGVVVDSAQARAVGSWTHSTHTRPFIGDGYLHDGNSAKGEKTITFQPDPPVAGMHEVRFAYTAGDNRAGSVPVTVYHAGGETVIRVDERQPPPIDGRFISLGVFRFEQSGFGSVLVSNEGTSGHVIADAVQFLPTAVGAGGPGVATVPSRGPGSGPATAVAKQDPDLVRLGELESRLKHRVAAGPKRPAAMSAPEATAISDLAIHRRGSVKALGRVVPRGVPAFGHVAMAMAMPTNSSGRLEFAGWLTSTNNPLTARVLANRIWLWVMGEGLVRSPDNFGTTGDAPTHPALLDYLAVRLSTPVESGGLGWSTKRLVRELMLSRTYQLSSRPSVALARIDPANRLLGRANRRRLTAEQQRDAMLALAGTLDLGRPHGPTFPEQQVADYGYVDSSLRRSVYVPVFRNALPDLFTAFDFPPTALVTGRRSESVIPTQALFMLNHPFVRTQAEAASRRFAGTTGIPRQVDLLWKAAVGRAPGPGELRLAGDILATATDPGEGWVELVHALIASPDFRTLK